MRALRERPRYAVAAALLLAALLVLTAVIALAIDGGDSEAISARDTAQQRSAARGRELRRVREQLARSEAGQRRTAARVRRLERSRRAAVARERRLRAALRRTRRSLTAAGLPAP